jgi:hypothetical protein
MVKVEKKRATINDFPGFGPVGMQAAVKELSRSGFAVWAWLCSSDPKTLKTGRARLARSFGYSKDAFDDVLRELARKGYIAFIPHGPYRPTTITIERRMVIKIGGAIIRAYAVALCVYPICFAVWGTT